MLYLLIVLIFIIVYFSFKSIKIVNQSEVFIIERLGKYYKTADAGLTIIFPFIDRVSAIVLLKELTLYIPPQAFITKNDVTVNIDTFVFYQITNPEKSVYEIANLKKGIEYLTITTIRDVVGKIDSDKVSDSRDAINYKLGLILDETTNKWGCKINRIEIKNIKLLTDIRDTLEN